MSVLIRLRNLCKSYGTDSFPVPVLHNITLDVQDGEYVAVMGPSGSGKSTLMNIIGCLDRPTTGQYLLRGQDVTGLSDNELADIRLKEIGFVFQTFDLMPGETALDNVALPLVYAGVKKSERQERAREGLENVGLGERTDFKPSQLSGGQKQRVAIARAMINHPHLLLADEPTGALDQKSGAQVMRLFADLNNQGVTIVMITHDAHVAAYAHRRVDIVDGRLSNEEWGES